MTTYGSAAHLQTRATARAGDYTFLGEAPDPWWRAYRDATAFEHPTLLVTCGEHTWHAYLSGIPSARTDAVGTVVRYTLELTGGSDESLTGCALAAITAWLGDIASGARTQRFYGALSAALDDRFPADEVDRLVAARPALVERRPWNPACDIEETMRRELDSAVGLAAVEQQIVAALRTLPVPPRGVRSDEWPRERPDDWLGAVTDPGARAAFLARVAMLLRERQQGRALLLNLVGGPDDAAALLDPASPVAVLVDGPAPAGVTLLRSEVDAKKARAAVLRPRRTSVAAIATTAALPVLATAVVLAALVVTVLVLLF